MSYTYDIRPSPKLNQGGWNLEAEAKLWVQGRQVYSKRRRRFILHPALLILLAGVIVITFYNVLAFIL